MRLIYRYANRKMYDTASRAFVNLGQVLAMIREGVKVKIVDRVSGLDITRVVHLKALAAEAEALADKIGRAAGDAPDKLAREIARLREELGAIRRTLEKQEV